MLSDRDRDRGDREKMDVDREDRDRRDNGANGDDRKRTSTAYINLLHLPILTVLFSA
jgi:hypothetical protein